MLKFFSSLLVVLFAFVFLVVLSIIGIHLWDLLKAVIEGAKTLAPEIYVPLVVTLTTAALGLAATLFTQSQSRKREIDAAHRDKKIEVYFGFLKNVEAMLLSANSELGGSELDGTEFAKKHVELRTMAVLWGSTGVLKALKDFAHNGGSGHAAMLALESLQREMRKDIGLSNFGLEKYFFTKLILKSEDEFKKFLLVLDSNTKPR